MNIEFPYKLGTKFRIVRTPHGPKGPTFDEIYEAESVTVSAHFKKDGTTKFSDFTYYFSRDENGMTCSLGALYSNGDWFSHCVMGEPLDWKIEAVES